MMRGIPRPFWEMINAVTGLTDVPLALGPHDYVFSVLRAVLPGGAPAYLIDCPALYARGSVYTADPDEHLRFLALTRAALLACQRLDQHVPRKARVTDSLEVGVRRVCPKQKTRGRHGDDPVVAWRGQ